MWPHLVNSALGIWLMFAPENLGLENAPATRLYILAPIIVAFAVISCSEVTRPARWIVFLSGIYLLLDPWIWRDWHSDYKAATNAISCGAALAVLSLWRGRAKKRFGGGWNALWHPDEREVYE